MGIVITFFTRFGGMMDYYYFYIRRIEWIGFTVYGQDGRLLPEGV